jgi:hypothetical protein
MQHFWEIFGELLNLGHFENGTQSCSLTPEITTEKPMEQLETHFLACKPK